VFDSSKIPGEIQICSSSNTETLGNPSLARAGRIWYETIALMKTNPTRQIARERGEIVGHRPCRFETQLKTTYMYYTPKGRAAFMTGAELPRIMDQVRFCFSTICSRKGEVERCIGIMTPTRLSAPARTSSCGSTPPT